MPGRGVCQAGVSTFCSQELGGNPMTLSLETAATRDELEDTAQVVLSLPLQFVLIWGTHICHHGLPCVLGLWLLC